MQKHNVPSPDFKVFRSYQEGYQFLSKHDGSVVVKADGLAAGKGAFVCQDQEGASNALYDCMEDRIFGPAGATVVVVTGATRSNTRIRPPWGNTCKSTNSTAALAT